MGIPKLRCALRTDQQPANTPVLFSVARHQPSRALKALLQLGIVDSGRAIFSPTIRLLRRVNEGIWKRC